MDDTMTNNIAIENDYTPINTVVKSNKEKNQCTLRKEIGGTKTEKRLSCVLDDRETID